MFSDLFKFSPLACLFQSEDRITNDGKREEMFDF